MGEYWQKIGKKVSEPFDTMSERADRGQAVWTKMPVGEPQAVGLAPDQVATSAAQQAAQRQFDQNMAAKEAAAAQRAQYYDLLSKGYSEQEIAAFLGK